MRRIGLTGGIGSGKSTVAALLVAEGAVLVDTDAIARRIAEPGGIAMPAIEAAFGRTVIAPDGGLDRAGMRQLVFADSSARKRLESIPHPLIGAETERLAAAAGQAPAGPSWRHPACSTRPAGLPSHRRKIPAASSPAARRHQAQARSQAQVQAPLPPEVLRPVQSPTVTPFQNATWPRMFPAS